MKHTVIDEVATERRRQIEQEGYDAAHDDEHERGELVWAAICYATPGFIFGRTIHANSVTFGDPWPWELRYDKRAYDGNVLLSNVQLSKSKRRSLLIKAAALLVAEIERLDRRAP